MTAPNAEHLRGPWKAVLSLHGEVIGGDDPFAELIPSDEVDISIRRGTALPDKDDEDSLPRTCRSGDVIDLWDDLYVEDGDPSTDAAARWAQAQAMAAGLNAAVQPKLIVSAPKLTPEQQSELEAIVQRHARRGRAAFPAGMRVYGTGCRCDWLGEGTPEHAPSPLCRSLRPDADRDDDPAVTE